MTLERFETSSMHHACGMTTCAHSFIFSFAEIVDQSFSDDRAA